MTTKQDDVTQADRDAASAIHEALPGAIPAYSKQIRKGLHDNDSLPQALASHRIASTRQAEADIAELVEALESTTSELRRLLSMIAHIRCLEAYPPKGDHEAAGELRDYQERAEAALDQGETTLLAKHRQSQENERG